jgi:hypothetical protein
MLTLAASLLVLTTMSLMLLSLPMSLTLHLLWSVL